MHPACGGGSLKSIPMSILLWPLRKKHPYLNSEEKLRIQLGMLLTYIV